MNNLHPLTRVAIFTAANAVQNDAMKLMLDDRDEEAAVEYERAGRLYAEGDYPLALQHCQDMAKALRDVPTPAVPG